MMSERPPVVGRLADLFFFAPLGFLLQAPRLVPELAETGRRSVEGLRSLTGLRGTGPRRCQAGSEPRPEPGPGATAPADPEREVVIVVEREDLDAASRQGGDGDSAGAPPGLPIPGYDQLAASQVIARLRGLSAADLDRIEAHERANRRRRTVLTKISQLRPA